MTKSFAENRSHFAKLGLLADVNKTLYNFERSSNSNILDFKKEIKALKDSIEKSNTILIEQNKNRYKEKIHSFYSSLVNLFSRKKKKSD